MSNLAPYIHNVPTWNNFTLNHTDFSALINALADGAIVIDRSTEQIIHVNSNILKLTLFTYTDLIGREIKTLLPQTEISKLSIGIDQLVMLKRRMRDSIPAMMKVQTLDSEGHRLLITIISKERYKDNKPEEWDKRVLSIQSLTESINEPNLEQALIKTIEIAESFLDTNIICVYKADSDNPCLHRLLGSDGSDIFPDELPSTDLMKLSKTSIWVPGKRILTSIHQAALSANLSYLASSPLGQKGALSGLIIAGGYGNPPQKNFSNLMNILSGIISNAFSHYILIENLYKDNHELQHSQIISEILRENMQEGVLLVDNGHNILNINQAAELMFEYTYKEVLGQSIENILIGSDLIIPALQDAFVGLPSHDIGIVSLHQRCGQSFPASIQIIPVKKDDNVIAALILIEDMSEKEQIRLRTRQLEHRAMLGELLSIFAHEIRNPINNISTGLELISSRLASDDPNRDVVIRSQNDCERLNHLVESTLSFSRPVDSSHFMPVDMSILIQRVLDRWQPRLVKAGIRPFFQASDALPKVMGDFRSLERVFINLISNAVNAMNKSGGMLAIRVGLDNAIINNPQVEITISDNGVGIPDEIRERLFEPFVTASPGGTGLGLPITKHIITSHRGSINVNTFPGGTVFHVFLPATSNGDQR